MPIAVMAERQMPVKNGAMKKPIGSHTNALRREKTLNHKVVAISIRLRPNWSASRPPTMAPTNMPKKVAEITKPNVSTPMCQCAMMAGEANDNVLMLPSSKKNMNPTDQRMRLWNEKIGRLSRRAATKSVSAIFRPITYYLARLGETRTRDKGHTFHDSASGAVDDDALDLHLAILLFRLDGHIHDAARVPNAQNTGLAHQRRTDRVHNSAFDRGGNRGG